MGDLEDSKIDKVPSMQPGKSEFGSKYPHKCQHSAANVQPHGLGEGLQSTGELLKLADQ